MFHQPAQLRARTTTAGHLCFLTTAAWIGSGEGGHRIQCACCLKPTAKIKNKKADRICQHLRAQGLHKLFWVGLPSTVWVGWGSNAFEQASPQPAVQHPCTAFQVGIHIHCACIMALTAGPVLCRLSGMHHFPARFRHIPGKAILPVARRQ